MTDHPGLPSREDVAARLEGSAIADTREGGQSALWGPGSHLRPDSLAHNVTVPAEMVGLTLDDLAERAGCTVAELVIPRDVRRFVEGRPAPQGSKRGFVNKHTKRVTLVESSKRVKPWRAAVVAGFRENGRPIARYERAIAVHLDFVLPRPTRLPKRKATPPATVRPDIDKLARSTLDALTDAEVIVDDSHVVSLTATKRYAETGERAGCLVWINGPRAEQ